ncbi:MAG TPA: HAMP domain-containing protein [Candidatus Merdenecus merdavium]|nr:HAMP domain-containing protein [Candidatus Merdenecus merdavium]
MKHSLYFKFLFAYLLFGFLSIFTITTLTSTLTRNYLIKSKVSALNKEAMSIASGNISDYYMTEESGLTEIYSNLKTISTYQNTQIWIINRQDRRVIINTGEKFNQTENKVIEDFNPTSTGNKAYQIGKFYNTFSDDKLSVISPISSGYKVKGYVIIHYPMSELEAERNEFLKVVYLTLIAIFLLSLIILLAFTLIVFIPLKRITKATTEYASGNLDYELPVYTEDEMGYLSASLNYMSHELSKSEEYQRNFVANISHDFRSPLTSIKGYVEAILDGTIPPEMQEKYLNIVLFETERLNKLTSSLLTLNNFDMKKSLLDITEFDIIKMIKLTAETFGGSCRNKMISIELILSSKSLYVMADLGKIQQVLYNLLDNAIKFSHKNSTITVETTEKYDKVFVSVKDEGIGIPKENLKKVWDRFFKSDTSRGKDKKGTGLGLAIVKEIIQAHDENINVVSTEGVGTEFIFTLPRSKNHPSD